MKGRVANASQQTVNLQQKAAQATNEKLRGADVGTLREDEEDLFHFLISYQDEVTKSSQNDAIGEIHDADKSVEEHMVV